MSSIYSWSAAISLAISFVAPLPICAEDARSWSIGVRAGFSGPPIGGHRTPENFQQYDVVARVRLPWEWYSESGWGIGTQLLTSAGALRAAGETAFITTFSPGFTLGKKDGSIALEGGFGGALVSETRFGSQDLGGPFQFMWNMRLRAVVFRGFGVGYWYQHTSDAGIYGTGSRGFNLHGVELGYSF